MFVGYTDSFSVRFFVLLNSYVCRWSKIFGMWIFCLHVLTNWIPMYVGGAKYSECEYFAYMCWQEERRRNLNLHGWDRRRGPDLTSCLVGLRPHSQSHRGRCSTRTGPKYVGSLVCTESLRMNVGHTKSFSIRFLSIPTILYIPY
jgi:hypothetical protein